MRATRRGAWARFAGLLALVIAADQATKALVVSDIVLGERIEVLPFLDLVHVRNEGVAFGFLGGAGMGLILLITAIALVFVIGWFARDASRPWAWVAVGLLAGGAVGNLVDRLARDAVIDFIDLPRWPSFNIADIAITLGAVALALLAFASDDVGRDDQRAGDASG